jgi:hypothetical protein
MGYKLFRFVSIYSTIVRYYRYLSMLNMKGVAAGPVKKALRWSCEKTVRCSTPLKSNKNYQAARIVIHDEFDLLKGDWPKK